jgi:hypothetical protein
MQGLRHGSEWRVFEIFRLSLVACHKGFTDWFGEVMLFVLIVKQSGSNLKS